MALCFTFLAALVFAAPATAQFVPDDEFYDSGVPISSDPGQWNLRTIGMEQAWNISKGVSDITIAIVDGRALITHPDLASALATPSGYDFVSDDADPSMGQIRRSTATMPRSPQGSLSRGRTTAL